MEWVKLDSTFYLDAAVIRAGEAAEVLFVRAMAYCGDQENDGVVPREILPRLAPTRARARAAALVAEGLWEVVPEGWRFVSWTRHQRTREQMAADREGGRTRQARHRGRKKGDAVSNGVTDALVTEERREEEEKTAAAAAGEAAAADLPPRLAVLRSKMRGYTALSGLRWETLTADQGDAIEAELDRHGSDGRLVEIAVRTCRTPPPVFVSAFIRTWQESPAPGENVRAVTTSPPCTMPGHNGTTTHCTECASEALAVKGTRS